MGIAPEIIVVDGDLETQPEIFVKRSMTKAGLDQSRLPTAWEENGFYIVGSSAVHRIIRPEGYSEDPAATQPHLNNIGPQPIKASAKTESNAWQVYSGLITRSCLRLETSEGPKFIRFSAPAAAVAPA